MNDKISDFTISDLLCNTRSSGLLALALIHALEGIGLSVPPHARMKLDVNTKMNSITMTATIKTRRKDEPDPPAIIRML